MAKLLLLNDDPDLILLVERILKSVGHEINGDFSIETKEALFNT
jgi:hypothetical protein